MVSKKTRNTHPSVVCLIVQYYYYIGKVFGIVQSTDSFKEQHLVMNGCSDVLMEIFGKPAGYHARSAIGTSTLPLDVSVEIEAVIQYK